MEDVSVENVEKAVELLKKYRDSVKDFDHQVIKVGKDDVFIHFHDDEIEVHIVSSKPTEE